MVASCQSNPDDPNTDRGALQTYLRQTPGVPLVLPTTLPEQYDFLGPGFQQSRDHRIVVRTTDFRLGDALVLDICTAEPGSPADVCVPPGAEAGTVERTVGAYLVWIRPLGSDAWPAQALEFWTAVPLTADLAAVEWLT